MSYKHSDILGEVEKNLKDSEFTKKKKKRKEKAKVSKRDCFKINFKISRQIY